MFALNSVYLNSAYLGPTPLRAKEKVEAVLARTLDPAGLPCEEWFEWTDNVRGQFATLLGCGMNHIALSTSVSELVSHVANGLSLQPSEEVLLLDGDYPSMILPWMVLSDLRLFQVRRLPLRTFLEPALLKSEITSRTRFVGCSHVMFNTGIQLPIADLGRICRERQVLFLADTSQSLGGMSLSSDILHNVDILVGVAYKWLLGPYGSAYGCFSKEAMSSLPRTHASWLVSPIAKDTENLLNYTTATLPGARKFDRGQSASFLITAALAGALEIISEVGLREIEQHNAGLVAHFLEHLPKGNTVAGPQDFRSNIVCVRPATKDAKALKALLAQNSIDVSVREGLVRFSFHFFNTREHVEKTLPLLTTT